MDEIMYYTTYGFYLGYSPEAVVAFLQRRHDINNRQVTEKTPTSQGTHLEDLGFIPSERELAMSREEVISDINSRRKYSVPFPTDDDESLESELKAFYQQLPSEETRLKWIAYLLHVVHNVPFLQEVSNELHLHIDLERRR